MGCVTTMFPERMGCVTMLTLLLAIWTYTAHSSMNVALNKPTWVSSTWRSDVLSGNVVDGTGLANDVLLFTTCIHTRTENYPRWWVNLTGAYTISSIFINYRPSTSVRMSGFELIVSNNETRRTGYVAKPTGHVCRQESRPNPPTNQSISCLSRGSFITYLDYVRHYRDPYPYIELCELEAFGCLDRFYGPNCSAQCPEVCIDGLCNPDDGTCAFGCIRGLQGLGCNETCDGGTFGFGCNQSCYCEYDTCDPVDGSCPDGRCRRGWNGTACNEQCINQTFGHNCEKTCRCLQGSCNVENGTCLNGECDPGWQTHSCSKECDRGRYGPNCNVTCGACTGSDVCHHVTGECPDGCKNGWRESPFCTELCPDGTFGYNCTEMCFCRNDTCHPTNGLCPDGQCDRGWHGPTCNSECMGGTFGYNCHEECHCDSDTCNRTNGQCSPGGCKNGWKTDTCSQKCDEYTHGNNCSGVCGMCLGGVACHHTNGHCSGGCTPGFQGELCNTECDDYTYGSGCEMSCDGCNHGKCHHGNGSCLQGCITGRIGLACSLNQLEDKGNMMMGAGAAAGVFVLLVAIIVLALLIRRRKRKTPDDVGLKVAVHKADDSFYCEIEDIEKNSPKSNGIEKSNVIPETEAVIYSLPTDLDGEDAGISVGKMDDNISRASMASQLSDCHHENYEDSVEDMGGQDDSVYTNTIAINTKINISKLSEVIALKNASKVFHEEYKDLPRGLLREHEFGKRPGNKSKNRFKDMVPYDHSRVVLGTLPNVPDSDYINGNYIDSVSQTGHYIAVQGPKKTTMWDFWRMVWEQNTGKIIMVTNLKEGTKTKCHKYWPVVGGTVSNGRLAVQLMEEKRYLAFITHTMRIKDEDTKESRTILHFQFTIWPDHGVPQPFQLVQFQRHIGRQQVKPTGPVVVHCSAGIGRTGTYIGLDALVEHSRTSDSIDIYQYVRTMRNDRLNMVQTVEQYIALHEALLVSLTIPDSSFPKSQIGGVEDVRLSRIQTEFKNLCNLKPTFDQKDYDVAMSEANVKKNRSQDCITSSRFRVRLKSPANGRTDYINAVVLPSCTRPIAFLATQLPLKDTIIDFWCMVYDCNSSTIVLLDRPEQTELFYPEDENSRLEFGEFRVTTTGITQSVADTEEIDLCLQKQGEKERRLRLCVCNGDSPMSTNEMLHVLSSTIALDMSTKTKLFTVVCRDGHTKCMPFCLLNAVIERIDMDNIIDMFNATREIQNRKPEAFATVEEYVYCYQVLEEYVHMTSIYSNE